MATKQLYSANLFHRMSFGDFGFRHLGPGETSLSGERFCLIQALDNTNVDFTNNTPGGDTTITGLTMKDFHEILGDITDLTVNQGNVIAYLRN